MYFMMAAKGTKRKFSDQIFMSAFGEETVKQQAYLDYSKNTNLLVRFTGKLERSPSALNGRQSDV